MLSELDFGKMPPRDRGDFMRILECVKMFDNIDVLPNARLITKALGWNTGRPYWSNKHDEMLKQVIAIVFGDVGDGFHASFNGRIRLKHLGTELQMYPKSLAKPGYARINLPVTFFFGERTMNYSAVGGSI